MRPRKGRLPWRVYEHFRDGGGPLTTTDLCEMFEVDFQVAHQIIRRMERGSCWSVDIRRSRKAPNGMPRKVIYGVKINSN